MGSNYGLDRDFSSGRVKVRMGFVSDLEVAAGGFMETGEGKKARVSRMAPRFLALGEGQSQGEHQQSQRHMAFYVYFQ